MKKNCKVLVCLLLVLCLFGCSKKEKKLEDIIEGKWYYLDDVYLELGSNNSASYYKAYGEQNDSGTTQHLEQFTGFYQIASDGATLTITYKEHGDVGSSKRSSCDYTDVFEFTYDEEGTPILTMVNSRGGLSDTYVRFSASFKKK